MTQTYKKLNDSPAMRWTALGVVAFTMMAAYFVNDVVAPLKTILESDLGWSSREFGFFTGAYSFLNVFLLMLIWGGFILDRFGARFTGKLAATLMVAGTALEYYAMTAMAGSTATILGYKSGVMVASAGYAIFGVGAEVAGITVTKIIAKWFRGKELATAMGVQVALARIGSQAAYSAAIPLARSFGLTAPVLLGLCLLVGGLISFFIFSVMDRKLDSQIEQTADTDEEKFSFKDVGSIFTNRGFWLIALLCVLFYSCVFPFQKFASEFLMNKYGISEQLTGTIAGMPAIGGAAMLIFVHAMYAVPFITAPAVAVALMIILGIAFSLVPSAMWPAVAKIFPQHQLGTAYALIFFIQNIGLLGVPNLIGWILDTFCITGTNGAANTYDYTLPELTFTIMAALSLIVAFLLKAADRKYGYHLEEPNIHK